MIVIGDLHIKRIEPYWIGMKQFLSWIMKTYPKENLVFLGDVYDTSTPHWETVEYLQDKFSNYRGQIYVLLGNHETSYQKGNALTSLSRIENVKLFSEREEIIIDNKKCLFVPYVVDSKHIEIDNIVWEGDYLFCHLTPKEKSFTNLGVSFPKVKVKNIIYGHVHEPDSFGRSIIVGVPQVTRNLEQKHKLRILKIDNELSSIDVPVFMTIEDIEFGNFPNNHNNLLNIKNAPSLKEVYSKYSDYFIRLEGISVLQNSGQFNITNFKILQESIENKFIAIAKEKNIGQDVIDISLSYFEKEKSL